MTDRAAWLAERQQGIGGSDVAAIFGLDPYKSAVDLYHEKRGDVEDGPPSPDMQRGRVLEPVAAELYTEATGRSMRRQPARAHPEYPWMRCNIDRQLLRSPQDAVLREFRPEPPATPGVWEAKCPRTRGFGKVEREGLPKHIILQVQHNMGVWGYEWGAVAVFSAERWQLLHFDLEFDAELWSTLVEAEARFWNEYVLPGVEPPVEAPAIDVPAVDADAQIVTREDPEWAAAVDRLRQARELKAEATDVEALAKQQLIELMGEADAVEGAGARIYYRQRDGRRTFDKKALERARPLDRERLFTALAQYPDIIEDHNLLAALQETADEAVLDLAAFEKQGKPYRDFRPYFLRGEA